MSWRGLPVIGLFLFTLAGLTLAPAGLAATEGDWPAVWAFGFSAVVTSVGGLLLSLASFGRRSRSEVRAEFLTLFLVLFGAPLLAALPIVILLPHIAYEAAVFEMVSSFTTTGASIFDRPGELSNAVNLWRVLCSWFGGFIALLMAFALLAPRNLGGYEVRGALDRGGAIGRLRGVPEWAGGGRKEAAGDRLATAFRGILPIYAALTGALTVCLFAAGQPAFLALASAMSLVSTSGVQVTDEGMFAEIGTRGEIIAVFFLVLAASRHIYRSERPLRDRLSRFPADPEMRLLVSAVVGATLFLFLRHWIATFDLEGAGGLVGPARALWGGFFTALSFATTTGVESASWDAARTWSGLGNPALILIGLAVMGGGIASTAGGVKLLRAYALFKHGQREMERLVRPSSIAGSGAAKRGLRREGAQIAWVFLMLFLVALGLTMLAVSLTGVEFDFGLAASVAALSNTGPLFGATMEEASWLTSLPPGARAVLMVAMILGRVETLAVIAMLNPGNWR